MYKSSTVAFILCLLAPNTSIQSSSEASTVAKAVGAAKACCPSNKNIALLGAAGLLFAGWIRLATKSTNKSKIKRSWQEFFEKLTSLINITQITTDKYWETFDSVIIGDQLKLIDVSRKIKEENGVIITYRDKEAKSYPSGLFGMFDAYILQTIEKLLKHIGSLKEGYTLGDDILHMPPCE